jgi:RNA polymerase sigma factor (sigma-70 family)
VIAARPCLAPHAAPSWHRHACSARVIVVRPSLALPSPIRPQDHLGLVRTIARQYARACPYCGMDAEDMAQEGWFGLVTACRRYDPGRGVKFPAFARWWIRAAIVGAIEDQAHPVRVPHMVRNDFNRERRAKRERDGMPGPDTGLSAGARACLEAARPFLAAPPVQEADTGRGLGLPELAVDPHSIDPEADDLDAEDGLRPLHGPITDDRLRLRDAVAALPARERIVIRLGYGLDGGEPLTHAQVAARLGLTHRSAKGFRVRAVRRLRAMLGVAPPAGNQRKGGSSCSC